MLPRVQIPMDKFSSLGTPSEHFHPDLPFAYMFGEVPVENSAALKTKASATMKSYSSTLAMLKDNSLRQLWPAHQEGGEPGVNAMIKVCEEARAECQANGQYFPLEDYVSL